ncbi:hypothetical protein [Phytohabitans houttuyneae]|uniref:Uncharacterized protein n=1 Tax=Phytohabitans houttuyneae TaxID=1076126 RepID=A0A6V8KC60_9ACTN|nr:hypothetical protein [Phytohabitans houttuyneae]GFJ82822.1 hypothetical protein Phou_070020 [Phytohabitans houttuyneae]
MSHLERRYQRLLFTYPRAYRRSRGEEMVGLLMDAAPPGRTRPTLREAANLVRHGLRARLGRPASRTVVVWAALTATICGLFGAAVATRLAWETARPMPDRAETAAILAEVAPEHRFTDIQVAPALFTFYSQRVRLENLNHIVFPDGGEYSQATGTANATGAPPMPAAAAVTRAEARLRHAGWRIHPRSADAYESCTDKMCAAMARITMTTVTAGRGDTVLTATFTEPRVDAAAPYLSVGLQRTPPPAVLPAGVAGGLLGAALAWLLFGWASRRTEGRVGPVLCLAATLFFWWAPSAVALPSMVDHHLDEPHPIPHPFWEWLALPALSVFFLAGVATALLGLALAAARSGAGAPAIRRVG